MKTDWYCCDTEIPGRKDFELCRIQSRKARNPEDGTIIYDYVVVTYYDGKILMSGTLKQCSEWINGHWVERRYLDQYAKRD